ncbi:MAG: hypothetical protein AAB473_01985 [Patescibacteria group bacterium]
MMNRFTRKQVVLGVSILVVLLVAGYVFWQKEGRKLVDPYYGLVTSIDVQMEDSTRVLLQQRLATAQASLSSQISSGADVDKQLYLVIAENEKMLGDLVASRKMYETYLDVMPTSYVAWNSYAVLLEMMKDYPMAETGYKKSLELLKTEEYYRDYVEFLKLHYPDRRDDVKVLLDDAYKNLLQTPWTMTALGDWFFETGDCDQGKAHYDVAISITSQDTATLKQDQQEKLATCEAPR